MHSYFIFFFQWKDANENANGDAQRAKKKLSAPVLCHFSAMILIFAKYYQMMEKEILFWREDTDIG